MGCASEEEQNDEDSFGRVLDEETISRGIFDPKDVNPNTGHVKMSAFSNKQLKECQFSVWRQRIDKGISDDDLKEELSKVAQRVKNQKLYGIMRVTAGEIRKISVLDYLNDQAFCIVDETECEKGGRKHPAHANMGFSDRLLAVIDGDPVQEALQGAKEKLHLIMTKNLEKIG